MNPEDRIECILLTFKSSSNEMIRLDFIQGKLFLEEKGRCAHWKTLASIKLTYQDIGLNQSHSYSYSFRICYMKTSFSIQISFFQRLMVHYKVPKILLWNNGFSRGKFMYCKSHNIISRSRKCTIAVQRHLVTSYLN